MFDGLIRMADYSSASELAEGKTRGDESLAEEKSKENKTGTRKEDQNERHSSTKCPQFPLFSKH
jgi:hypothetical protein